MFNWLARLLKATGRRLGHLGECGLTGLIVGAVVGMMLTMLYWRHGATGIFTDQELLYIALMLTVFGWVVVMFVLVVLVRASFAWVRLPSFINALLVAFLTTFVCARAGILKGAWLIGMLIGALVGYLLCTLYRKITG